MTQSQLPPNAVVLERGYTKKGRPKWLVLDGNRDRSMGILRCGHEFSLSLIADTLEFDFADSIDCGEWNTYEKEEEFESAYPGVLGEIRKANAEGRLYIREYDWDEARKASVPRFARYRVS